MQTFLQDLRYGLRMLAKNPGFTAVAVITLALGIGANTAIFSVVNAVLLRPLYNQDPKRLVRVTESFRGQSGIEVSPPDLSDWKHQSRSFAWMAGFKDEDLNILGGSEPEWVSGVQVDANLFRWLGIQPLLGRAFLPEEGQPGKDRVALLSYGLWQRRFGGDPGIVGRSVTIEARDPHAFLYVDGQARAESYSVVGVMKPYFQFPPPTYRVDFTDYEAWIPLSFYGKRANQREEHSLEVVAYLKPDVSLKKAQAEMDTITRRMGQEHELNHREIGASVVPLQEVYVHDVRPALQMLLGAVCLVLLIACANVANLQLVRSATRQREIAVRTALGATRRKIIGQLLLESVLLAGFGGVAGLLLANWGTDVLVGIGPEAISHSWKIAVDGRVLLFTLGISLLAGVIFGLTPAVQAARVDLNQSLKETARTLNACVHRNFARKSLLISEVALSFVLLIGAGLLIRSYLRLQHIDLGFRPDHVMTLQVNLLESRYATAERRAAFFEQALKRIETLPGMESVGATTELPMIAAPWGGRIIRRDRGASPSAAPAEEGGAAFIMISPKYLQTMGTPLKAGRYFTERDRLTPAQVGMASEALARRLWPHDNPLGKRLGLFIKSEKPTWVEIVGVVGDIKHFGPEKEAVEAVYLPDLRVNPNSWLIYVMRGSTNLFSLARAAEREIHAIDKEAPVVYPRPMEWWVASMTAGRRFNTLLLGIFAAVALLLAAVGIYGVISFAVAQRTQEIGIRMALGAQQSNVLKLVVGQGLKLAIVGLGIGLVACFALTRLLSSFLFGISATDPATFAGVSLLLGTIALVASYIPARRATKVDPMVALRYE